MVIPSGVSSFRISLNTRAVIPTDVAARIAPKQSVTVEESTGVAEPDCNESAGNERENNSRSTYNSRLPGKTQETRKICFESGYK